MRAEAQELRRRKTLKRKRRQELQPILKLFQLWSCGVRDRLCFHRWSASPVTLARKKNALKMRKKGTELSGMPRT